MTAEKSEPVAGRTSVTGANLPSGGQHAPPTLHVALLTAGRDKPYALGMGDALIQQNVLTDFICGDAVDAPFLHETPLINFLNLRNQAENPGKLQKMTRVLGYYARLIQYAVTAKPRVFHILWQNKFEFFDRVVLMRFYKLLGKRIVFTAHNVNAGKRDGKDTFWNRLSLKSEYRLADHILVHTEMMKRELMKEFPVPAEKITVIPFGINNTLPNTGLTRAEARRKLGVAPTDKTLLFFGNIAPYKGVEYLTAALVKLLARDPSYRLIIAGRPKGCEDYWAAICAEMDRTGIRRRVVEKIIYIPDEDVEIYFKASDLLVLPYTLIFQSGVLFLGYSFGVPVLAADVGALKEEIVVGQTGYVCQPKNPDDLAQKIETYFASPLYRELEQRGPEIQAFANDRYSWNKVGAITKKIYTQLAQGR